MEKSVGKRVMIVQSADIVRLGLIHIITFSSEMIVCAETRNLNHAQSSLVLEKPDLVIIDAMMEEGAGFDFVHQIKLQSKDVKSVVFSHSLNPVETRRAVQCGADAILFHDHTQEMIMDTLINITEGKAQSPLLGLIVKDEEVRSDPVKHEVKPDIVGLLSKREMEVFKRMGKGMSVKQIAADLTISHRTVESHQARMKEKLGVKNSDHLKRLSFLSVRNTQS